MNPRASEKIVEVNLFLIIWAFKLFRTIFLIDLVSKHRTK